MAPISRTLRADAELARLAKWIDDIPIVIVEHGRPLEHLREEERIDEEDVLNAARERLGLERMDQITYAVLERSGGIFIVPERER